MIKKCGDGTPLPDNSGPADFVNDYKSLVLTIDSNSILPISQINLTKFLILIVCLVDRCHVVPGSALNAKRRVASITSLICIIPIILSLFFNFQQYDDVIGSITHQQPSKANKTNNTQ